MLAGLQVAPASDSSGLLRAEPLRTHQRLLLHGGNLHVLVAQNTALHVLQDMYLRVRGGLHTDGY